MSVTKQISTRGPGLKKQGVVTLQSLLIALVTLIELLLRDGVGIFTGVIILAAFFGGLRFGRPGTNYVATVTPPLAFAGSAFLFTLLIDGFKLSRVGIDLIAALASEAPFLIIGAACGWFIFLNAKAKNKPPKARD